MIAIAKKGQREPEGKVRDYPVVFQASDNTFVLSRLLFVPDGWRRVPMTKLIAISQRSSTRWITPDNSADGQKMVERLIDEWTSEIAQQKKPEETESVTMTLLGEARKNTMMDVSRKRKMRSRWANS